MPLFRSAQYTARHMGQELLGRDLQGLSTNIHVSSDEVVDRGFNAVSGTGVEGKVPWMYWSRSRIELDT